MFLRPSSATECFNGAGNRGGDRVPDMANSDDEVTLLVMSRIVRYRTVHRGAAPPHWTQTPH